MKTIEMVLSEEVLQLRGIINSAKKRLETAPTGGLRIAQKRNGVEYYYKEDRRVEDAKSSEGESRQKNRNGRYMRKRELPFVK